MILGSKGDDSKLLGQSLRRGSYLSERGILLLLQGLVSVPLQAVGSPVPKTSPLVIWAMEAGKLLWLEGIGDCLLVAEDLSGPRSDGQGEPQMWSPWGGIAAGDAMQGRKQPLGYHIVVQHPALPRGAGEWDIWPHDLCLELVGPLSAH